MNSLSSIFALFSLLLFTTLVESRAGPGSYGEKIAIEKKAMPEDLWKLVKEKFEISLPDEKGEKADCNENEKPNIKFDKGRFELRPNIWIYDDDNKIPESRTGKFEPRPYIWMYDDDNIIPQSRTLEDKPRSNDVVGNMNRKDNGPKNKLSFEVKAKNQAFEDDFEPRPNVSAYND